jgi:hypothetical protein
MRTGPARQRGIVTVIAAIFIIVTIALMVEVLHRTTGSDILDTAVQNDSLEALFIAETGVEHASYLYANGAPGTACTGLAGASGNAGRGTFTITSAILVGSDCQIHVSADISTLGVQRVVEAVLTDGGNLLANDNADFDDPPPPCSPCMPTGWTLSPNGWQDGAGPSGAIDDRAAYVEKPNPGSSTATTAGSFGLTPFTVTAPAVLTLNFDYKVVTSGGSPKEAQISFTVSDGTTTYPASPSPFESGNTGAFLPDSVTINIGGTSPVTITNLSFVLFAKAGQPKQIWLDNLDLQDPGSGSGVALRQWREIVAN